MAHQSSKGELGCRSREPSGAVTLLLAARVSEAKRAEFLLSARSFGPTGGFAFYEGIDDPALICAVSRLHAPSTDASYLGSDGFRALKGALRTLTSGWTLTVLREHESWCAEPRQDR